MKHTKNNLVLASISVLAVISFRLTGVSSRYLAAEVYTQFARNAPFTLALILPVIYDTGVNFAIVVGAIFAQMAMTFSVDLRLEGAVALMSVAGANIVLPILFGMMVTTPLNRTRGHEMTVPVVIGQLSSVIYQFIFMVAYGLLIQSRNRDILLDRGVGVRGMADVRNISSVFKGMLPFRLDGKTYPLFPLIIILFFSLVLFYIQRTWLGTLTRAVGTNEGTAGTLGIAGNRVHSICIVISTILMAVNQILFVAGFGTINVYIGHLDLDTLAAAAILVGGASIRKARMRDCFIGVILFYALFITSSITGQNSSHNPSVREYFRSSLVYEVTMTATVMSLGNERIKIRSI